MIKNLYISLMCLAVCMILPIQTLAQVTLTDVNTVTEDTPMLPNTVSCFDYYKFGSVQVDFSTNVSETVPGTPVTFTGTLNNNNAYPVVGGTLLVKIFKERNPNVKDPNGPDVVDEFVALNNVAVQGNSSIPVKFTWQVPATMDAGAYKAVTFFVTDGRFNLLGLSFTDDIIGNTAEFKVSGSNKVVRFDKEEVTVNDRTYLFASFPPRVQKEEQVTLGAVLNNPTDEAQTIPVTWEVYTWDGMRAENLLEQTSQTINVPAKGNVKVSYVVKDMVKGVYYARATAEYKGTKSLLNIRFVRDGVGAPRINFPSLTAFPLVKDQPVTVFSCLHVNNDVLFPIGGALKLTVKDMDDNIIHEYEYKGFIMSSMLGVKDEFVPTKDYTNVKLLAELSDGESVIDSTEIVYSCKDLGLPGCQTDWFGLGGLILVVLSGLVLMIRKMRRPTTVMMILLAGVAVWMAAPHTVDAKEVQWNTTSVPRMSSSWGNKKSDLENVNVTVTYKATAATEAGVPLQGGEVLPVGSKIKLTVTPHVSDHIYWFGMGGVYDSPYGEWRAGATAPTTSCQDKDLTTVAPELRGIGRLDWRFMYFPLVISPPEKTLGGLQNMTCEPMVNGQSTCTVTGTGPTSATVQFGATSGHFYYQYIRIDGSRAEQRNGIPVSPSLSMLTAQDRNGCQKLNTPFGNYTLQVPAQTITFGFSGNDENNQPPTDPVITGPITGSTNQAYSFTVKSTDPDDDKLKYGVVWGSGDTINEWAPGSGYVPDETEQTITRTWSGPGVYTFKVKAFDERGLFSGWSTHTITISDVDKCVNVTGNQDVANFSAHGREYFYSGADGKLYFVNAGTSGTCQIDMCADTPESELVIPQGYGWNSAAATEYEKYSCTIGAANCSCAGRTLECSQGGAAISSTPNAPQCALRANCTYAVQGNQVAFNYFMLNARGTISPVPSQTLHEITNDGNPIRESKTFTDSFDGMTATAVCEYPNDGQVEDPKDPKIISFTATPIVEQGQSCVFAWDTQDMSSCSLSGEDHGITNTGVGFPTTAGRNITKVLTCTTDEEDRSTQMSLTKTCFVKPKVIEN